MGQLIHRLLCVVFCGILLAACGGGDGAVGSGGGSATRDTGSTTASTSPSLALTLIDSGANKTTSITESQQGTLVAKVLSAGGVPVAETVVTFQLDNTNIGTLEPASGTALTNASGEARITLKAGTAAGAATATATATVNDESVSDTQAFSTSLANIALGSGSGAGFSEGSLEPSVAPPAELSAGGTMTITATVADQDNANALFTSPVEVSFTSSCVAASKATIDGTVTTVGGTAVATYRADGCVGSDTITASAPGGLSASTNILVAAAAAGSLEFVSATPGTIALKGTGDSERPETSTVVFKVLDINGNPRAGQTVNFNLSTTVGGLSLSTTSATSDSSGLVQTVVNAGTVPTNVRVHARFTTGGGTDLFTVSSNLTLSTGLPDQNSLSLSRDIETPQGWDRDGEKVTFTARLADRFNNPVPDNTTVLFTTEGGVIEPSCVTEGGACNVIWTSQNPRPADGRVTVLATAIGEEDFTDLNGNGLYDDGEPVSSLPEAFRDADESGVWESGEFFRDFDEDSQYTLADSFYNGSLCTSAAKTLGHCASLVEVRESSIIVMSSAVPEVGGITFSPASITVTDDGKANISATVQDVNGNSPPNGTTVAFTVTVGSLQGQTSFTVGNQLDPFDADLEFKGEATDSTLNGKLTAKVTTPAGDETTASIPITINP
ncbi:hypothetical protein [Motiliproteus sp. SC1-56]|uniref:hypothetical protein n=1 Tax=Motiliproteus sp. SC1-56 TaxID=2799565 RepID=UPI001A8D57BD|nr:hypothetical protein [Motiliproteus sp. SC1-56]